MRCYPPARELRVPFFPFLLAVERDLVERPRRLGVDFLAAVFLTPAALVVFRFAFEARFFGADAFFFGVADARFTFRLDPVFRFRAAPIAAPESAPITVPTTGTPRAVPATAPATAPPRVLPAVPVAVSVTASSLFLSSMFLSQS